MLDFLSVRGPCIKVRKHIWWPQPKANTVSCLPWEISHWLWTEIKNMWWWFIVIWQRILQLTFSSDKATRYFSELIGSLGTCQFYQIYLFIVLTVILMNSFLWGGCGSGDRAKRWSPNYMIVKTNLLDHLQWNHKNTHKNNRDEYLYWYGLGKDRMSQWKISAYKGLNLNAGTCS